MSPARYALSLLIWTLATSAAAVVLPYGTWPSPIDARRVAQGGGGDADLIASRGVLTWTEIRPDQNGRSTLLRLDRDGRLTELTPPPWDVRSGVHDGGGGAHGVAGRTEWIANFADQRLYLLGAAAPRPLTPEGFRYADCAPTSKGRRLVCVREDHTAPGEPRNTLVLADLAAGGAGRLLFDAADFVAYPRLSPDGRQLAFIAWRHPNMPWDGTQLLVGRLVGKTLTDLRVIAGSDHESVMDPQWDQDGSLYFLSDRSGWSNLYRWRQGKVTPMWRRAVDLDAPLTRLGLSNFALTGDGRAAARFSDGGRDRLAIIDLRLRTARILKTPFVRLESLRLRSADKLAMFAAKDDEQPALVEVDLNSGAWRRLAPVAGWAPPKSLVSRARAVDFPSPMGGVGHAFFYPPLNPGFTDTAHLPPLIVQAHGGPVGSSGPALDLGIQFWTSRGFAVLDVNFHGSAGYGRAYRQSIYGQWGVADLQDVIAATRYAVASGWCDPHRTAIHGRSGGGFLVLSALAFTRQFQAGADYYGISDLETLAATTHKFESRYPERLVAPLPEGRSLFQARSPIHHLDGITSPLVIFQGAEDHVVPPEQSRRIAEALKARGNDVQYFEFPGEGHGFRQESDRVVSLEAEYALYRRVFGLP